MQKVTQINKRRKKKNIFKKIFMFILVLSLLVIFALNSSLFDIKQIKITGNKQLNKESILKDSKIKKNTNIFKLKTELVESNLEKNPFIKSVLIKRSFPSTIDMEVLEREKMFLIQYSSIFLVVDREGTIMEHLEKKDKKLPLIKGFNTEFTEVTKNVFTSEENSNLQIFINESEKNKILVKIDEVDKDFANEVNIKLKNEITVAFGTLDNVKYKLSLLKEILEDVEKKEIKKGKIVMNKGSHPILIIDD